MAQNIVKGTKKPILKKTKTESKIMSWIGNRLNLEKIIGKEFPVRYIDRAGFLLILGLILIAFRLNAERQMRQMRKLTNEIHQLQATYTIRKAHYMKSGKQSELAPKLQTLGLIESKQAPYRIIVKPVEK